MIGEKWNIFCQWIIQLIFLNMLWIMTVILGFIIFGFGPATYASYSTIRQWQKSGLAHNTWFYYSKYLKENIKHNIIFGISFLAFIVIILIDLLAVKHFILRTGLFISTFLAAPIILLYFPIKAHFDFENYKDCFKLIYQLFIRNILWCLIMFVTLILFVYLMIRWLPAYFILIGIAGAHYLIAFFLKKIYIKENVWEL